VAWYRCINTILKLCTLPATVFIHTLLSSKLGPCAKLSQAKVLTGGRGIARSASRRPPLFAIPAFNRVAGLCNRHRNSNKGIFLHWRFWSQAESLDWSWQRMAPMWHSTNYERDKLCLVGCLGSESRLVLSQTGRTLCWPLNGFIWVLGLSFRDVTSHVIRKY